MWMEKDWFSPKPTPEWPYIGTIGGANVISMTGTGNTDPDYAWDLTGNVVGMYNWVISTGTGSSSCGRVPFTVYHDCGTITGTEDEETFSSQMKVYPNPASDNLNITFNISESSETKIELINTLGSVVAINNLGLRSVGNQKVNITTSGLSGIWLVLIFSISPRTI